MYYNHKYGVKNETFYKNKLLYEHFYPITYNFDKKNNSFISLVESKKYPIWGSQFHPEKNPLYDLLIKVNLLLINLSIIHRKQFKYQEVFLCFLLMRQEKTRINF